MAETQQVAAPAQDSSGTNFLFGVILLIVALGLFFYFGVPAIQNATSTPQITVPDKVDVNVNSK